MLSIFLLAINCPGFHLLNPNYEIIFKSNICGRTKQEKSAGFPEGARNMYNGRFLGRWWSLKHASLFFLGHAGFVCMYNNPAQNVWNCVLGESQ